MSVPPTTDVRTTSAWPGLVAIVALSVVYLHVGLRHVQLEQFFYYWDNFAYNRAALESLEALTAPGVSWLQHLRTSMQSGFSQLFTITIAPLMYVLGEDRSAFIGGLVGFFLLPCAFLGTVIVNQLERLSRWEWPLVFLACASLPVLWRATLAGYPDIGGLVLALGAMLVVLRDPEYRKWRTALGTGFLLAWVFLFRRHLIYSLVPLMAAAGSCAFLFWLRSGASRRWSRLGGLVLRLAATTALTLAIIAAVAPAFFQELLRTNFRQLYLPYQFPLVDAWRQHRDFIGIVPGLLGLAGLAWSAWPGRRQAPAAAVVLGYFAGSIAIWVCYLRYLSVQYNLHFAVAISIGLGLLVVRLNRATGRTWPGAVLALLLAGCWADRLALWQPLPVAFDHVLPRRTPPLVNADYRQVRSLIDELRNRATAGRNKVLVAASSGRLNSDMLVVGEASLYGRRNRALAVMNGSHADTVQPYPLRDMLSADWIVVVAPFEHHLRVEDQGVVLASYDAMMAPWPFASQFRRTDLETVLANGSRVVLFERTAPTPPEVELATARSIFDLVGTTDAWTGPFMTGFAATGAEYYDVRMLTQTAPGNYLGDFEQVRFEPGQQEIKLYVRLPGGGPRTVEAIFGGSVARRYQIAAEYHPDDAAPANPSARTVTTGEPFSWTAPGSGAGVAILHIRPASGVTPGTPLGLQLHNLVLK